ncbi:MAG TPA: hypothetical protein DCY24_00870 [Rikenellaceae bacterium]|nr:hypothetical protein [Rikenellaceae bacterium]
MSALSMAQTRTIEHEYSEFDAISVSDGFKVTMVERDGYNAKFKVSDALESYLECYVKGGTLYIGIDDKSVPKDVKKSFKGKNSDGPILEATIYVPSLNSITLNDDCVFSCGNNLLKAGDFKMSLTGNSSIANLNVNAESAVISVSKKAKLSSFNVKAGSNVTVNAEGNASVVLEYSSKNLNVNNSGSADLAINGQCDAVAISTAGSAKLSLSGKANTLKVTGKGGSSKIDAISVSANDVVVSLDSAELTVAPGKNLSLDLGKGASVCYSGDPKIKIVKIQNASVTRK